MRTLPLTDGLRAYLTDPAFRTGVVSMRAAGDKAIPHGLHWAELPAYYRAVAAALHVRSDFAIAYAELWSLVWAESVAPWRPMRPDDQLSLTGWDAPLDVASVDRYGFVRCFEARKPDWIVSTDAWFNQDEIGIGIAAMSRSRRKNIIELDIDGFDEDEDDEGYVRFTCDLDLSSGGVDVDSLIEAAARAVRYVQAQGDA